MNRYPIWIYVIVACAMVLGFTYTLPNFFGESPAVQVSSIKATVKVDSDLLARVQASLKAANVLSQGTFLDANSVKVRFADTDTQLKAKDVLSQSLNPERDDPSYVVALNLLSSSPTWLTAIHALPMYLGLDLRGGVHFTLQVDMKAALTKRLENLTGDIRVELRDKNLRYSGISREGNAILLSFRDADTRANARKVLEDNSRT
jgi:preprotein translocase subunit SecD